MEVVSRSITAATTIRRRLPARRSRHDGHPEPRLTAELCRSSNRSQTSVRAVARTSSSGSQTRSAHARSATAGLLRRSLTQPFCIHARRRTSGGRRRPYSRCLPKPPVRSICGPTPANTRALAPSTSCRSSRSRGRRWTIASHSRGRSGRRCPNASACPSSSTRSAADPARRPRGCPARGIGGAGDADGSGTWVPDFGPRAPHPSAGATVIGARRPLIAYNVNLDTDRIDVARTIAASIRESSGGFKYVKAPASGWRIAGSSRSR